MIFVTDAHVAPQLGNVEPFFAMLDHLAKSDEDLVFMGDIFDLWIGHARYEGAEHRRFLAWCRDQKQRRRIGFVEGNHEFYVVRRHRECFTWSDEAALARRDLGLLIVHGDLINRADTQYLRWRKLSKSWGMRWFIRLLPFGGRLVQRLKKNLKNTNKEFRLGLPKEALAAYADEQLDGKVRRIVVGHFHAAHRVQVGEGVLDVLPDWYATGQIAVFRPEEQVLKTIPWSEYAAP
ncbi:metallophosphoesterase [Acanthopleuribacter pedis]|uniref:Metallophosphoesterase n=1 Tax=Acanthopleuribacter pedis TaxID=442870 RepID=A0A8J7Q2Y9_9BACT|nr:metallophosphoesterase [Acanthopleuribacter pedis]MBO1317157.1 metallophosphoesterase [Acanthopleuribacter pedis]